MTETGGGPALGGSRLYVGIDVGRRRHLVAAIPRERMENGSWERAIPRSFATSASGFTALTSWLETFGVATTEVIVGCEPTGGWYARTVVAWLERHGYQTDWLQNWAVHDKRQLLIGKQTKTDALDARLIARLLFEREALGASRGFLHHPPRATEALRLLVRNRLKLVGLRTRYRLQLTAVEDVLFPELKDFFLKSTTLTTARLVLEHFPTPALLAAASPQEVSEVVIRQAHAIRLAPRLPALQQLATNSAGLTEGTEQILQSQRWLLRQLRLVDEELSLLDRGLEQALHAWSAQERAVLASLPDMSTLRQAVLLSSIGDINSFRDDRQLRKLLGWYPEALESGSSVSQHKLGQGGNRLARREIYLWAMALLAPLHPPNPFRAYYRRLRARGLTGKVALGHVASKLISVLFYCLRNGQPYDPVRHARDLGLDDA